MIFILKAYQCATLPRLFLLAASDGVMEKQLLFHADCHPHHPTDTGKRENSQQEENTAGDLPLLNLLPLL